MTPEPGSAVREERFKGVGGLNISFRSWSASGTRSRSRRHLPWIQLAQRSLPVGRRAAPSGGARGLCRSTCAAAVSPTASATTSRTWRTTTATSPSWWRWRSRGSPGLPVFLLGHSAGGVISCIYTLFHQSELAGLICESFAFRVPAPDFALAALKGLAHVAPHAHVMKLHNEHFSRDPAWVKALNEDPLIAHEVQPTQTVAEMVRADERLEQEFFLIRLPLLILHGTADKVTKPSRQPALLRAGRFSRQDAEALRRPLP